MAVALDAGEARCWRDAPARTPARIIRIEADPSAGAGNAVWALRSALAIDQYPQTVASISKRRYRRPGTSRKGMIGSGTDVVGDHRGS
jgi:hypothetical protein